MVQIILIVQQLLEQPILAAAGVVLVGLGEVLTILHRAQAVQESY
jgi:hypothetical protein